MIGLHAKNARELTLDLQKNGELAEGSGEATNAIHSPLTGASAFLNGPDDSVLQGVIDGEQRNTECPVGVTVISLIRHRDARADIGADAERRLELRAVAGVASVRWKP